MRLRGLAIIVVAAASLAGCGVTETTIGQVSPQVTATITIHPSGGGLPSKAETEAGSDVISARLRAIGVGSFTIAAGSDLTVSIEGVVDVFRAQLVVQTPGVLRFVINPGSGTPPPVGHAADGLVALWDGDEIVAVSSGNDPGGHPTTTIQLGAAGAAAFTAFTAGHVGERLTMALDRVVLASMTIVAPDVGGTTLEFATPEFMPADVLTAILVNGPLPPGWRQP